ncbi:MAG: hypothetical protein MUF87_01420 [Anaerolineae bacterium]|nr:hypothetical protein [Anaerolineae bacterium]
MNTAPQEEQALLDDPVLGQAIANYPSDRAKLLIVGGLIYLPVSSLVNLLFADTDPATAAIIVITFMSLLALLIGWVILHWWNREVVLYVRGFAYREGSRMVFIAYPEVRTFRQRIERVSYFGGLIKRTIHEITITTTADETIVLNMIYRRIGELGQRLEKEIHAALQSIIAIRLREGQAIPFSADFTIDQHGLRAGDRRLAWADYAGYQITQGHLVIKAQGDPQWHQLPIRAIDNVTLLLEQLQAHS